MSDDASESSGRTELSDVEMRTPECLTADGPSTSTAVAASLWPDSTGWLRANGRGVQGLARGAARVMRRLEARGLVEVRTGDDRVSRWGLR